MSRPEQPRGQGWFLPSLVPVVLLTVLLTLHHSRTIYTSDSTAQQSIVRTWLDVGHGLTYVPLDTWALKIPIYLVLEQVPLPALDRLLIAVLVLNVLTFLLLGWAVHRLAAGGGAGVRRYEVAVPLAWLATLGGGIGSNRQLPNYRNIELGLCMVMLALMAGYLMARRPAGGLRPGPRAIALGTGAAALLGLLWVDDPYFSWLLAGPLIGAALVWFLVRERDPRLLHLAAVLAGSFVLAGVLRAIGRRAGVRFFTPDHTLAFAPDDLLKHLELLLPSAALQLGTDRWDTGPGDLLTRIVVIAVVVAMLAASAALAVHGWRRGQFVPAFLGAHWPLVVAGFMVSWHTQDRSAGRYLILALVDLVVATAVLLPPLRLHRPALAGALVGLLAVGAVLNFSTGAATAIDAARRPSAALPHQQEVVRAVERAVDEHGAVKGYAPFWSANITTYLVGRRTTANELVCRDGRLATRTWLTDSARLTRPAGTVFVIWDPKPLTPSGCTAQARDAQLGPPIATYPLTPSPVPSAGGSSVAVLVYAPDIQDRLEPPGGA